MADNINNEDNNFPKVEQQPEEDCEDAEKIEQEAGNAEMYEIENEDHINMGIEAGEDNLEGLDNEEADDNNDQEKPNEEQEGIDSEDDDESDDDVKITIGDITAGPASYTAFNVKRGPGSAPQGMGEKSKFTMDEFEGSMAINGVPAHEFSVDSQEEKPWRKPGADITDYFNYGFNELTWQAYCERQRRMRMESGAGVPASLGLGPPPKMIIPPAPIPIAVVNENSKYAGSVMVKKAGPPPARKMAGAIDVIGGGNLSSRRPESGVSPSSPSLEESNEQSEAPPVAEKPSVSIDFSRPPPGFPNMALPPPFGMPPPVIPPPLMMAPPPIVPDPYGAGEFLPGPGAPGDDYYQYEPTQDSQWGTSDWRGPPPMGIPLPMGLNVNKAPGLSRRDSMGTPPVPGDDSRTSSSSRRRRSSRSRSPKDDRDTKDKELDKESRSGKERDRSERERDRDRSQRSDRRDRGSGRERERGDRDRDRSERDRSDRRRRKSRTRSPTSSHKRSSKRSKRDRSKSKSSSE
nr:EOG090X0BVA [Eubosmina coregoni]